MLFRSELDNYFDTKSFLFDSDEHLWIATKKGIIRIMDSQKNLLELGGWAFGMVLALLFVIIGNIVYKRKIKKGG